MEHKCNVPFCNGIKYLELGQRTLCEYDEHERRTFNTYRLPPMKFTYKQTLPALLKPPGAISWRPSRWERFKKWAFGIDWLEEIKSYPQQNGVKGD